MPTYWLTIFVQPIAAQCWRRRIYRQFLKKNTIFNEHPVLAGRSSLLGLRCLYLNKEIGLLLLTFFVIFVIQPGNLFYFNVETITLIMIHLLFTSLPEIFRFSNETRFL